MIATSTEERRPGLFGAYHGRQGFMSASNGCSDGPSDEPPRRLLELDLNLGFRLRCDPSSVPLVV